MEHIKTQVEQLATAWHPIFETLKANPALLDAQLPGTKPEQIDELIQTVVKWVGFTRAPKGFNPTFHVAKGLAVTAIPTAQAATTRLATGDYTIFPGFVSSLGQIASAFHLMMAFSDRDATRNAVADLGGRLAESVALLDTAQKELAEKMVMLNRATQIIANSEKAVATAKAAEEAVQLSKNTVEELTTEIAAAKGSAQEYVDAIEEVVDKNIKNEKANAEFFIKLTQQQQHLDKLAADAEKQERQIAALLPKGASAGLAFAFAHRVGQVERTKWMWLVVFVFSVSALSWTALDLAAPAPGTLSDAWRDLFYRLPLAAPLVWLGWFSAMQYGNVVRLQEDYAFKEATSKAFAGYKDHMEHMRSVDTAESNNAMRLLSEETIKILAQSPLRIYGRTAQDAAPSQSFVDAVSKMLKGKDT